ncbi:MAG: 50S ribosomal protein L21 [Crocinitomicaceae bacterium]|nr:50S ribosomal protein L21 [Crocinitomicaceae bacterium]MDC0098783.1 50S ribosomal protein L21 [Crocinitomicaceae bacterium]MDC1385567.1 50S ribosomal protein L21 [Crocinitomicaceae bacterium]
MYAIVEIAGQQFKVQKDQKIFVHRLDAEEGKKISFDKVLLVDNDGKVTLGAPAIEGATVSAKVETHVKGDKVIVFRKKRRKGYKKKNGHRQSFTAITISDIKVGGAKPAAAKKAEVTKEKAPKAEAKKAPAKKAAPKKEAAPKKKEEK